jgi:hypothetical protein
LLIHTAPKERPDKTSSGAGIASGSLSDAQKIRLVCSRESMMLSFTIPNSVEAPILIPLSAIHTVNELVGKKDSGVGQAPMLLG